MRRNEQLIDRTNLLFTPSLDNQGDVEKQSRLVGNKIAIDRGAMLVESDSVEIRGQLSMDRGEVRGMEST